MTPFRPGTWLQLLFTESLTTSTHLALPEDALFAELYAASALLPPVAASHTNCSSDAFSRDGSQQSDPTGKDRHPPVQENWTDDRAGRD